MNSLWLKLAFGIGFVVTVPSLRTTSQITSEPLATRQTAEAPPSGSPISTAAPTPSESVTVDVLVTDEDGRIVPNLTKSNFRLLDNGREQAIENVGAVSEPLTVVVLMEFSSGTYSYFASKSANWADRFLDHLDARDWVALVTYDLRPTVQVDFTHNRYEVRDKLQSSLAPAFGESNLFDALIETLDKLDKVRGRKAILLISTGENSFSAATFDDVMRRLRSSNTTVFCVGLAEAESMRTATPAGYQQGRNWLRVIATQTGGLAMFPRFEGELPSIFDSFVGFLHNEYELTFTPPKQNRDGRYHRLKVEVMGPDRRPLKVVNQDGKRRGIEVFAPEGYMARVEAAR
jgi:VWFA-related protein